MGRRARRVEGGAALEGAYAVDQVQEGGDRYDDRKGADERGEQDENGAKAVWPRRAAVGREAPFGRVAPEPGQAE